MEEEKTYHTDARATGLPARPEGPEPDRSLSIHSTEGTSTGCGTQPDDGPASGGQMSISPPANVKQDIQSESRVLASGIDSLYLSLDGTWEGDLFLDELRAAKKRAQQEGKDVPFRIGTEEEGNLFCGVAKSFGARGYEWIIEGRDMTLRIGNWMEPGPKPGVLVELRSELLWRVGPHAAVEMVTDLLEYAGFKVEKCMVSRADLCSDILVPTENWGMEILESIVTRAANAAQYTSQNHLTGVAIGKGAISARIYDKPMEIAKKGEKAWMYDIWGLESVPEGFRILRVEFQLRRAALKQWRVDTFEDLLKEIDGIWAACTKKWLRVVDDRRKHHTQQKLLEWWRAIQENFLGSQEAKPAIRKRAATYDYKRLKNRIFGLVASYIALINLTYWKKAPAYIDTKEFFIKFGKEMRRQGLDGTLLAEEIRRKQARYQRVMVKQRQDEQRESREETGGSDDSH